jgi:hypothetical protein
MQRKLLGGVGLLGACLLLLTPSGYGQAVYGNIFGTVTDSTGAVVPNATVTVLDEGKGTSVTVTSNASGEFTVDHLIPDNYDIKVAASGFKTYETKGLQIFADTSSKIEAALQVGGGGETVEVSADTVPQLKTDRADVSTTFEAKQIQDLPIGDRNFTNLQLLLPGAQQLGWAHAADENPQGSKQIDVDGQAFGGVAFQLDGTDNQDPILGIIVINPNIDSLSQSKITTQNFDAEFGKAVSSVVTAQTKSGSNSFHGSAFDYRESNADLARDPFNQPVGSAFPGGLKNQFGGSLGGPIIKDRAFFFVDYQGVRQKVGTSALQTVPTTNLISTCLGQTVSTSGIAGCDFSQYPTTIYDNTPGGNGQPYPSNVIPTRELSPQALALFKLLQPYAPNNQSDSDFPGLRNNYGASGTGLFNSDQYDVRGDYQVSATMHAFGRFSRFTDVLSGSTLFGPAGGNGFGLGNYGGNSVGANDSAALGLDIAINSSLLTDIRLGYYKYHITDQKYNQTTDFASALGIPGENVGGLTGGAPSIEIAEVGSTTNYSGSGDSQGQGPQYGAGLNVDHCNCPLVEEEDQYQLVNNWTKTIGNHAVKFGADLRYAQNLRVPSDNDRTGVNQFGTGPTGAGPSIVINAQSQNYTNGGLGFATFVLGDVTSFNRYASTFTNAKEFQKRDFFYVQDTWRTTQKLTLNLGLRYEFYFPETINSTGAGSVMNLQTGYFQVAGYGSLGSNMGFQRSTFPLNPRIGAAYQVNDKLVVRAGYGRSFDIGVFGSIFGHVATQDLPVLVNQSLSQTAGNGSTVFNLAQGPAAPYFFTPVPSDGLLPAPGYAVSPKTRPITMRLPTIDAWNLSIQQSVTPTLSFTLAYVGNKGTHTLSAGDGNNTNPNESAINLPAQYSITGTPLHYDPSVTGTYAGVVDRDKNPISGVSQNGGTANQTLLERYYAGNLPACSDPLYAQQAMAYNVAIGLPAGSTPLFGLPSGSCGWSNSIGDYGDNQDTHYNALQVTVAKTFTHGYSINGNYAWQRAYDFNNGYATWDKSVTKGRNGSIREQQLIVYGLFELPFGRNHAFLSNSNTIVNELVGGWQFSPVITYSSGLPYTLSYNNCGDYIPNSAPCYVSGDPRLLHKHQTGFPGNGLSFYDKLASDAAGHIAPGQIFTEQTLDQIGNSGRNSTFGPHFFNGDLSLQKNFPIKESLVAQMRLDAFNGFNHINFATPNGNVQQGGSITGGPFPTGAQPRQLQISARFQF